MAHLIDNSDTYSSPSVASIGAFSDNVDLNPATTAGTTASNTNPSSPDFSKISSVPDGLGISSNASSAALPATNSAYLLEDPKLKKILLSDVSSWNPDFTISVTNTLLGWN